MEINTGFSSSLILSYLPGPFHLSVDLFGLCFGFTASNTQALLLALNLEITPGGAGEPYEMLEIVPVLTSCYPKRLTFST